MKGENYIGCCKCCIVTVALGLKGEHYLPYTLLQSAYTYFTHMYCISCFAKKIVICLMPINFVMYDKMLMKW